MTMGCDHDHIDNDHGMFGCCLSPSLIAIASVIIGLVFLQKKKAAERLEKLREKWNARPKDVVTLHMFSRAKTCPNPSPFPIKLETYLRAANIKHETDFEEQMSSKGKSPWITVNGVDVADSQLAIEYLTKNLGKDIESHLSPLEKANSRMMRIMLEEHFYWCLVVDRWVVTDPPEQPEYFPPDVLPLRVPRFLENFLYKQMGKRLIGAQANAAGIGRHSHEEVYKMAYEDLDALSLTLGDKPFLLGDQPCLADLTLFGFICMMTCLPKNTVSPVKHHIEKNCGNLFEHHKRLVEKYWPDYETARYGKE